MPAESKGQKQLACMALGYKKHGSRVLEGIRNKEQVIKMANSMTEEQLVEYCGSKVKK